MNKCKGIVVIERERERKEERKKRGERESAGVGKLVVRESKEGSLVRL